ncbi:aldo/keto reductase [Nesterenkonia xinjiangensis]|uniref:2,5-diketo-D-gluconate reductase A n=1 Tax=Nesterenkonia xinjiangensis TaxID=225327 RepID=A0A7Z0K934_9MICC|nr:aldo/keto reductase [Nesterenkonia xinjiangensis]NYJ76805.1 2,5-diketo-D-gluconate reductase A [Nesterenkonia xinjiangensis]
MEHLQLNSGTSIPQIGYGTGRSSDPARNVAAALEAGYRHVDTAQMYDNEAGVGEGVRASGVPRDDVFITTKLGNGNHAPDAVDRTLDESLVRLGVDAVDLFLVHWPMPGLDIDYVDTWRAMISVAETGRARAIGVSNFESHHLERIIEATGVFPAVNQIEIHPYFANNELRRWCWNHGLAVEAWSPLGKGDDLDDPAVQELATRLGRTPAQVILRWHLQRGDVIIPKTDHLERMASNLEILDWQLDEHDAAVLDALDRGEEGRRTAHPDHAVSTR